MRFRATIPASLVIALAACGGGDKNPAGPDGDCSRGTLTLGTIRAGAVAASDCSFPATSVARGKYDAYSVTLVAGRVYQVRLDAANELELDPFVEVISPGGDGIALADDNLSSFQSEVFFVAPSSGVYAIRAGGYGVNDLGEYELKVRDCAAITLGTPSTVTGALTTTDCSSRYSLSDDGNAVDVYVLPLTGAAVSITVTSTAMTPLFFVGGPDFLSTDANYLEFSTLGSPARMDIPAGVPAGTFLIIVSAQEQVTTNLPYAIETAPLIATAGALRAGAWMPPAAALAKRSQR